MAGEHEENEKFVDNGQEQPMQTINNRKNSTSTIFHHSKKRLLVIAIAMVIAVVVFMSAIFIARQFNKRRLESSALKTISSTALRNSTTTKEPFVDDFLIGKINGKICAKFYNSPNRQGKVHEIYVKSINC